MTDEEAIEIEQQAFKDFAIAHPHEAYATWPDRFWEFFHKQKPNLSRECMEECLKRTEETK
jgi:hypothetical protein